METLFKIIFLLSLFCLGLFPFASMLNKYFFKKQIKTVFYFTIIFNITFIFLFAISNLIKLDFLTSFSRFINYYFGFLLYAFLVSITFWGIYAVLRKINKERIILKNHVVVSLLTILVIINSIAIHNFHKLIAIEEYTIYSNKITKNYSFVQIADIQYGSVSKEHMEKVIKLAYAQDPDFIVFLGDLIDFEKYELKDFEVFEESKVPIYFVRGNHEYNKDPERINEYLKLITSIKYLRNQKDEFKEIEIVGIDYDSSKYQLKEKLKAIELDNNKFSLLLYHDPKGVEFAVKKGFDLALFGHTHAGQIWPITLLIDVMYEYGDGYYEEGDTKIYTTDGAGLWGPQMRLGSQNEISVFKLIAK
jgi:predicted MPP superfamily phosphohydrolase